MEIKGSLCENMLEHGCLYRLLSWELQHDQGDIVKNSPTLNDA